MQFLKWEDHEKHNKWLVKNDPQFFTKYTKITINNTSTYFTKKLWLHPQKWEDKEKREKKEETLH